MEPSVESIREKFETIQYSVHYLPTVLSADSDGVEVNGDAPYPDVIDEQERWKNHVPLKGHVPMPKLCARSYGDWSFSVSTVRANYFSSRERLEELMLEKEHRDISPQCIKAESIPIGEAMKKMNVDMSINMDYYLENRGELDVDLDRQISCNLDLGDRLVVKRIEQELFYRLMCKVFGRESDGDQVEIDGKEILYDKSFVIRDFSILSFDGNNMLATATRDEDYFMFQFDF